MTLDHLTELEQIKEQLQQIRADVLGFTDRIDYFIFRITVITRLERERLSQQAQKEHTETGQ